MKKYLFIISLVAVLGIASFSFYKTQKELPVNAPIVYPSKGTPFVFMQSDWRDQDVYLSYLDTAPEETMLTTDGQKKEVLNQAPSWVNEHEVSFIKCSYRKLADEKGKCALWTIDIVSRKAQEVFSEPIAISVHLGESGATIVEIRGGIGYYTWSHDGRSVVYFGLVEGRGVVRLFDRGRKASHEVLIFPESLGRGGSAADSIRIVFTPDDAYFLVNSTGDDQRHIFIFDRSGKQIDVIEGNFLTYPLWIDNTRILFTDGGLGVSIYDIKKKESVQVVSGQAWYETRLSPDGKKVVYTMIEDDEGKSAVWGKTSVWVYDIASQKSGLVVASADKPRWLSSNDLLVIKLKRCLPEKCEMSDYDFDGYKKITLSGVTSSLFLDNFASIATDPDITTGWATTFWVE